jgi:hypothetical protein
MMSNVRDSIEPFAIQYQKPSSEMTCPRVSDERYLKAHPPDPERPETDEAAGQGPGRTENSYGLIKYEPDKDRK